ncbi:MAG TPA: type II secretion system protein [Pyrinomonadaceae bacterium]|nr:type II secretion system protein [Pyrinomonadaceae bacterium]
MRKIPNRQQAERRAHGLARADGFSLIELTIAMALVLIMMAGASRLLMTSLGVRTRESQKSDALADAQRALNIMSREIGNSGFGMNYNGLVETDCHPTTAADPVTAQIRLRANVNNANGTISDSDEDVTFLYKGAQTRAIIRYDDVTKQSTVLAGEIDAMQITYINAAGGESTLATPTAVREAERVRVTIQVNLQATVGQPASQVLLTSEIALRNAPGVINNY